MFRLTRDVFFSLEWSYRLRAFLSAVLPVENISPIQCATAESANSATLLYIPYHISTPSIAATWLAI